MTILLIGFEASDSQDSASATVLSSVMDQQDEAWGDDVISEMLSVEKATIEEMHERQSQQLVELIFDYRPDVILFVGQIVGRNKLMLERFALNFFIDQRIAEEAAAAHWQTLPDLETWPQVLEKSGLNLGISNFSDTNVTNHALYSALHLANTEQLPLQAGLLHLPLLEDQRVDDEENQPFIPTEEAVSALALIVDGLLDFLEN